MPDREKVVATAIEQLDWYFKEDDGGAAERITKIAYQNLKDSILALLKEQEPRVMDDALLLEYDDAVWIENKRDTGTVLSICKSAADVEPKRKWIPVTERLPENTIPVNIVWVNHAPVSYYAICKDKPFVATGIYHRGTWYWWSATTEDYLNKYGRCEWDKVNGAIEITHWMPLPEPPKMDKEGNNG